MKTLAVLLGIFCSNLLTVPAGRQNATITVTIENVKNDYGKILVSLYTADTFMKGPGISNRQVDSLKGEITFTFEGVKPGTYAISVLHHENANYRMDYDTSGKPMEYYTVSGKPNPMGPPSFQDSKFEVSTEDQKLVLRF